MARILVASGLILSACGLLFASNVARADEPTHPIYHVEGFQIRYARSLSGLPRSQELEALQVRLSWDGSRYVAPDANRMVSLRLDAVAHERAPIFAPSALRSIHEQIVAELRRRGFSGIRVRPDSRDIDPKTGKDRRAGRTTLRIVVSIATVAEVQVRSQLGIRESDRKKIERDSPVQSGSPLRQDAIQEYLARLNRHPGRNVTARLRPAGRTGQVNVEYNVVEAKPWTFYARISNTGTHGTTRRREQLGAINRQLTGNDDVLRLDYITGDFDEVHALASAYERPLPGSERSRMSLRASWSQFDASELGRSDAFSGEQWSCGGQVYWNALQRADLFVDFFSGLRYQNVEVKDRTAGTRGDTAFLLPQLGVEVTGNTASVRLLGKVTLEHNAPELGGTDRNDLQLLGRMNADRHFSVLRWDGTLYVDPTAVLGADAERDAGWRQHEAKLALRGQYGFADRLSPYFQQSVGGLYTVRGYPQSTTSGDDASIWNIEYRVHMKGLKGPGWAPKDLRSFGLSVRAFVDGAHVAQNARLAGESDHTLWGAGVGFTIQVGRASFALDWSRALRSVGRVESGNREIYIVGTVLF